MTVSGRTGPVDFTIALENGAFYRGSEGPAIFTDALGIVDARNNLSRADFSPLELRPGQGTLVTLSRNVFKSCDFSGARFYRANLIRGDFTFARFNGADLRQADLTEADLSKADLRGADLTYANLTGADLYDTNLSGVKGLDTVKGLGTSKNLDKAIGVPSDIARQTK